MALIRRRRSLAVRGMVLEREVRIVISHDVVRPLLDRDGNVVAVVVRGILRHRRRSVGPRPAHADWMGGKGGPARPERVGGGGGGSDLSLRERREDEQVHR